MGEGALHQLRAAEKYIGPRPGLKHEQNVFTTKSFVHFQVPRSKMARITIVRGEIIDKIITVSGSHPD